MYCAVCFVDNVYLWDPLDVCRAVNEKSFETRKCRSGQTVLPHHATSRSATSPTIGRRIWVSFPSCRLTMFRSFLCLLSFLVFHPACSTLSISCIALGIDLQKSCPGWKWWDKWSWDFAFWKELEVPEELDVSLRLLYLQLLGIYTRRGMSLRKIAHGRWVRYVYVFWCLHRNGTISNAGPLIYCHKLGSHASIYQWNGSFVCSSIWCFFSPNPRIMMHQFV